MAALIASKDVIVDDLRGRKYSDLARAYGWDIVRGAARFAPGPVVEVDGRRIEAEHYLIATGSIPAVPPIEGLTDVSYLTSTTAMELREIPGSLIVIGGNYIGL
jgi:mercuric reductase